MTLKIYFDTDVEKRKYEGRSQTTILLEKFLRSKGYEFVNHPSKADLIQVHSSGIFASYRAAKWKKKYKIPVVYTLYSISKTEPLNHFRNHFAQRRYLRRRKTSFILSYSSVIPLSWRSLYLRKLDLVITPSYFVHKRLPKNSKVVRLGINLEKFKPLKVQKNQIIKVGYFGHPSAYKGVLDFARASKDLPNSCESYIFISDTSKKMEKNLLKINPKINLFGHVKDIAKSYNEMDIIVLPYRSHLAGVANPLVLVEAMACGKAVITTNFSYLKEVGQKGAYYIRPYSPKSIVKAVKKLHNQQLRNTLEKNSLRIAQREFNQRDMCESYVKIYERIEHNLKNAQR